MRLAILCLAVGCANTPANVPPRVVEPPPKKLEAKPSVRWVLERPAVSPGRALDLGGGKSLLVGVEGQRWLRSGGAWSHAERPLPEDLVAVLGGDGFDFVGLSGTVYRSKEPLGDALELHAAKYTGATASSGAILAITEGHQLVRSTDRGASYAPVSVGDGAVLEVALARDGRGLALLAPERVFVTRDHGATWTRAKLPDLEPEHVSIADDGAPYVGSGERGAKLTDAGFAPPTAAEAPKESGPRIAALAVDGARVVAVAHEKNQEPTVAVTTLDGKRVFKPIAGLGACRAVLAAAASDHVAVGCASSAALVVARSFDDGKSFRISEKLPFASPSGYLRPRVSLVAGAKGLLAYSDGYHVRLVKKEGEPPVEIGKNLSVFALALDEARARIVAAGEHLLTAPFDGGKIEQLGELGTIEDGAQLTIDDDARIHLVFNNYWGLHVVSDGVTKRYPLKQARSALAGERGLVAVGPRLYETSDGGAHLRDIGRAPTGPFACGSAGCAFASASRLGWSDAPATLAAEPLVEPPPPSAPARTILECKKVSAPLKVAVATPEPAAQLFPSPTVALRVPTQLGLVSGTLEKPAVTALFAQTKRKAMAVFHSVTGGFVAMRYLVAPKSAQSEGLRAVSLDLAWQRSGEKVVHKAAAGDLGTFRVRVGEAIEDLHWGYAAGIVDGGVVVRPAHPHNPKLKETATPPLFDDDEDDLLRLPFPDESGREPLLFVRDNGKIEKIALPPGQLVASAIYRSNDRWFLVSRTNDATATVRISSDDKGTSWQLRRVRLWPGPASITLDTSAGRPAFVVVPTDGKRGFVATLALDGSRELEVRSFGIPSLDRKHACSALDPGALRANVVHEGLEGLVGDDRVALDTWVLSVPPAGDACVAAVGGGAYQRGLFVGLNNPARSLWFLRGEHVQPVDCPL